MERYHLLCTHLEALVPEASNICIATENPTSHETQQLINTFMQFCSNHPGVVMLNADIIWEFLYIISDIVVRNNYKFKFQDQVQYNRNAGYQTQVYEEVVSIPLDTLPKRT